MATLTPGSYTYAEWALRHDKDGKVSSLVNMLSQSNAAMKDAVTVECQSGNAFEYTQVVKLPTPARRVYNQGVPRTLGGVAKLVSTCSEYGDWSVFDKSLAELGGDLNALRAQEDMLHIQGLGQLTASDLFYANRATDPTQFTGFANIYNTVSTATSPIAQNVLDMGGTGSTNTSLWLIGWGPKQIHMIYPKGTQAGMQHKDFGLGWATDANSNEYPVYRTWIEQKIGLAVHDWRYAVRACNIDVSLLNGGSAANLITALTRMVHIPPMMPAGVAPIQDADSVDVTMATRSAFYCNRTIFTYLDLQAQNKTNVWLQMQQWGTESVVTFRGIPIRCEDSLVNTEARVV